MNRYKKLLSDTAVYGVGTFASKILVFFLTRLYTECLTAAEYGKADLMTNLANLLIPLAAAGICDGIFRFTLDKDQDKRAVFSTGVLILSASGLIFLICSPLLYAFDYFREFAWVIVVYVLCSNFHSACAQYIRALDKTKLFAVQGIINTVLTISFNVLFLVVLPEDSFFNGVYGYVLSIVIADFIVGAFLFIYAKLWKSIGKQYVRRDLAVSMLKYSLPMIPTAIFWWVTNVSDRYMIKALLGNEGEATTGLYTAANKIPTLLTLVTGVFSEAWQFSAVREENAEERSKFYSVVFSSFQAVIFSAAAVIIAFSRVIAGILFSKSYFSAWEFIPILVLAASFSSFVNFLSSVYMVKKRSMKSFITSMIGALINVTLNLFLIPESVTFGGFAVHGFGLGAMGAAVATVISYVTVFLIRAIDSRKLLKFNLHPLQLCLNYFALILGSVAMLTIDNKWMLIGSQAALIVTVLLINVKPLINSAKTMIATFTKKDKIE